jgi:predicted dehydrogenase
MSERPRQPEGNGRRAAGPYASLDTHRYPGLVSQGDSANGDNVPRRRFRPSANGGPDANGDRAEINVGLVGLGYWGPNILRVVADQPETELRWICDMRPDRLERMARRYPSAGSTTEFADLLNDPDLDAILIATPVGTHAGLARASLEAGKHTFVEKPIAASAAEAEELAQLACDAGVVLMCGHTFTYRPPVRAVKKLLDEGELGELYFISSSRVNLGLHQRDVSVLWDLGPHDFSILRYWLEEGPESVAACGRDAVVAGIADVAFLTLRFGSGTLANLEMSWLAPSKLRRTVLVGSEKMVVYEDGAPEPVRVFDHGVVYRDPESFGEYHLSYRTGDIVSPHLDGSEPLALEIEDFVASVRAGSPRHDQLDLALDVVRMIEAAETSLLDDGRPVRVDAPAAAQLVP